MKKFLVTLILIFITSKTFAGVAYVDSFSFNTRESIPRTVAFNTDGIKMFVGGNTGNDINEFSLSTAFLPTTASFVRSLDVSSQSTSSLGLAFNSDGTSIEISRKF